MAKSTGKKALAIGLDTQALIEANKVKHLNAWAERLPEDLKRQLLSEVEICHDQIVEAINQEPNPFKANKIRSLRLSDVDEFLYQLGRAAKNAQD